VPDRTARLEKLGYGGRIQTALDANEGPKFVPPR